MAFYLFIKDDVINGRGQAKSLEFTNIEVSKEVYDNYSDYIYSDGEILINPNIEEEKAENRKKEFNNQFFEVPNAGYYRKKPKGYGSAVESLNTAFNMVSVLGKLPANSLTFYVAPDFTQEEQCTEEWLVANSFKNTEMTAEEFGLFYANFLTAWNNQEHL